MPLTVKIPPIMAQICTRKCRMSSFVCQKFTVTGENVYLKLLSLLTLCRLVVDAVP